MVRLQGSIFGDVTDRASRLLGTVYGFQDIIVGPTKLPIAGNDGVTVSSKPYWSRHGYGRVCVQDDFEGTLRWAQLAGTVTKASDATFVNEGTSAMKLVTGAVAGNPATAEIFALPLSTAALYTTLECWFALSAVADATPRDFTIVWFVSDKDQNNEMTFGVRYLNYNATAVQRKWQYWNSAGAWADLPATLNGRLRITNPQFHYVRLQLIRSPGVNYQYHQVFADAVGVDISGTLGQTGAYSINEQDIQIGCTTDVAAATTAYVDDFIIHSGTY